MMKRSSIAPAPSIKTTCYHCGDPCTSGHISIKEKDFCCQGCKTVYEILSANDLCDYYALENAPGLTGKKRIEHSFFDFLDSDAIKKQLLDFSSASHEKVTFYIPSIHCSSCIWLLENLGRLHEGVLESKVNFSRKTLTVDYVPGNISLRQVADLLAEIGYTPVINMEGTKEAGKPPKTYNKELILKIGIAGFCFGNVMLLSFPDYLGLQGVEQTYHHFFRYLSALLSLPVVFYSGWGYFVSAFRSIRQRHANIDLPIALGIFVLFLRSTYEVMLQTGSGYFDSLTGLVFFLLIGKWFQDKTYRALSFDRDYQSYFPLAVLRKEGEALTPVPVKELKKGDELLIRNGEVIPGDAILLDEEAAIDYSFVTGESEPVSQKKGDYLYAGGRQVGRSIRLLVQKEISQSYLTGLWNDEAFTKEKDHVSLIDKVSRYFTWIVVSVAVAGAAFWYFTEVSKMWLVFSAVLIIACPCALALATPFTTGSILRVFGRNRFYLKNASVVEKISDIDHIVFDKTGTITNIKERRISFTGSSLSDEEKTLVKVAVSSSTHPLSRLIYGHLTVEKDSFYALESFEEVQGKGILAIVSGVTVKMGSAAWVGVEQEQVNNVSTVYLSLGGDCRGCFEIKAHYREGVKGLLQTLGDNYQLSLLSGDHQGEKESLENIFPPRSRMDFEQGPDSKLRVIKGLGEAGDKVMMLGDGLNDAGALKLSEVGVAVTDDVSMFSPASDALLEGGSMRLLSRFLQLAKWGRKVTVSSFILSFAYNLGGIGFAVTGQLTPLVAAVLMPLSSISVVLFTTAMVHWRAKQLKLG